MGKPSLKDAVDNANKQYKYVKFIFGGFILTPIFETHLSIWKSTY